MDNNHWICEVQIAQSVKTRFVESSIEVKKGDFVVIKIKNIEHAAVVVNVYSMDRSDVQVLGEIERLFTDTESISLKYQKQWLETNGITETQIKSNDNQTTNETAADTSTQMDEKTVRLLKRLEDYFPDHKVSSLTGVNSELRQKLGVLQKSLGYETYREFLNAYGFEERAELNSSGEPFYKPGNEPEVIQLKMENVLQKLEEYYPDHKITEPIRKKHRNLAESVSGLTGYLGYPDHVAMLKAYGYSVEFVSNTSTGEKNKLIGRLPNNDIEIINILKTRYEGKPKAKTIQQIVNENPDFSGNLKTMSNRAYKSFGMSLKEYLIQQGLLISRDEKDSDISKNFLLIKFLDDGSSVWYQNAMNYSKVNDFVNVIDEKSKRIGIIVQKEHLTELQIKTITAEYKRAWEIVRLTPKQFTNFAKELLLKNVVDTSGEYNDSVSKNEEQSPEFTISDRVPYAVFKGLGMDVIHLYEYLSDIDSNLYGSGDVMFSEDRKTASIVVYDKDIENAMTTFSKIKVCMYCKEDEKIYVCYSESGQSYINKKVDITPKVTDEFQKHIISVSPDTYISDEWNDNQYFKER